MSSSFARTGLWSLVLQLTRIGANAGLFLVLAKFLDPTSIGVFVTAFSLVQIGQLIVRYGLSTAIVANQSLSEDALNAAFSSIILLSGFCTLLLISISVVAGMYGHGAFSLCLFALSFSLLFDGVSVVPDGLIRRSLRFRDLAIRSAIISVLSIAVVLTMAMNGYGLWSIVAFTLINSALISVAAMLLCGWRPTGIGTLAALKELAFPSYHYTVQHIAQGAFWPLAQLIVSASLGLPAAGVFGVALRVYTLVGALIFEPLRQIALPILVRSLSRDAMNIAFRSLTYVMGLLACFSYLAIVPLSGHLSDVFSADFDSSISIVLVGMLLSGPLACLYNFFYQYLSAASYSKEAMVASLIQFVVGILIVLLSTFVSIEAVAFSEMARSMVGIAIFSYILRRSGIFSGLFVSVIFSIFIVTFASLAASFAILSPLGGSFDSLYRSIIVLVGFVVLAASSVLTIDFFVFRGELRHSVGYLARTRA